MQRKPTSLPLGGRERPVQNRKYRQVSMPAACRAPRFSNGKKIQVKIAQLILLPLLKGKCPENIRFGTLPNGYDNDCSGQWMGRRLVVISSQTPTCQGIGPPKSSSPESPWQRSREMMLSVWCTSSMASCGVWHVSA